MRRTPNNTIKNMQLFAVMDVVNYKYLYPLGSTHCNLISLMALEIMANTSSGKGLSEGTKQWPKDMLTSIKLRAISHKMLSLSLYIYSVKIQLNNIQLFSSTNHFILRIELTYQLSNFPFLRNFHVLLS